MIYPVLIAMAVVGARGTLRLIDALAQQMVLRARRRMIRVTASLPPGIEIKENRTGWRIQTGRSGGRDH